MLCVLCDAELTPGTQFTSFTGTKVQILMLHAPAAAARESFAVSNSVQILLSLLAVLAQKYKY
jgi:hypothetical protein